MRRFIQIQRRLRWLAVVAVVAWVPLVACGQSVKGVSLASLHYRGSGYGSEVCARQLHMIRGMGANWVALSDFAWMESVNNPHVRYRSGSEGDMEQCIRDAHAAGLKVMIKPHLWSRDFGRAGKWHGDIRMTSEADWDDFFRQYGDYILHSARVAESAGAEALCVGVEYLGTSDQETRWRKLIADVREVYHGYVTYAASFLEWKNVKWWDAVDCIGIDAYFPVASTARASDEELRAGWAKVYGELVPWARRWNKPVCFLELGYSASSTAGERPWAYDIVEPDEAYQARLYRIALEEQARHGDVVVGVFVWKWFTADIPAGSGRRREPFMIQDRPLVCQVLARAWGGALPAAATQPIVER